MEVVLGIDIGGTFTKLGLVDKAGTMYFEDEIRTTENESIEDFIADIHRHVELHIQNRDKKVHLCGIGVGAPNGNFYSGTIEHAPNLVWKGIIPFVELMEKQFKLPAVVTNDAKTFWVSSYGTDVG